MRRTNLSFIVILALLAGLVGGVLLSQTRMGKTVLAIKEIVPERFTLIPTGAFLVKDSDALIVLGPDEVLKKLQAGDFRV